MDQTSPSSTSPSTEALAELQPLSQQQQQQETLEQQTVEMQAQQQQQQHAAKLTPEQEEELKLKSKYPNPQKPGGSTFIQKMLHRGSKKYFDSGDYNMAKSRTKAALNNANNNPQSTSNGKPIAQQKVCEETASPSSSIDNSSLNSSPLTGGQSPFSGSHATTTIIISSSESNNSSPYAGPHNTPLLQQHLATTPLASNINIVNNVNNCTSNSLNSIGTPSINVNTSPLIGGAHSPAGAVLLSNSSSNSSNSQTGNQHQHQHHHHLSSSTSSSSINMISASLSSDKLSNIQFNTDSLLDSEEIGHGIPTPECLPQSRKHSIAQSKLATPRLSTS